MRHPRLLVPVLAALAIGSTPGCGSESGIPDTLVDGSPVRTAAAEFEGLDEPVLLTETQRFDLPSARDVPKFASCLRGNWSSRPAAPVVYRVGTTGESVTFPDGSRRTLQACDGAGDGARSRDWCGHAFGRVSEGRLRDPRLDLGGCSTRDGDPIAFVWIEPVRGTRLVLVRRPGFWEAYETQASLPVRVATTERVDLARSSVVVEVSEHSASGDRLRAGEVEASVSG